jgi:hypothetical protein
MASVVITGVVIKCVRQVLRDVAVDRQLGKVFRVRSKRQCQQAQRRESVRVHFCCCRRWLTAIAAGVLSINDPGR